MKTVLSTLLVALLTLGICSPMEAGADEGVGKQFMRGLVRKSAQAVQDKMNKHARAMAGDEEGAIASGSQAPSMAALLTPGGITGVIIREIVKESLDAVKERYKEEGRLYARQIGDALAERIIQNGKVKSTLNTLKMMGFAIAAYLTLVTALLFLMLMKLHASNKRIEQLLKTQQQDSAAEEA